MSRNDRMLLLVIPVVAAVVAFWFLVLAPKQNQASKLDSQVTQLQSDVQTQQQAAQAGQQSRKTFPRDYHRLVVMGKAVPVDDETASLIVQVNRVAARSGVSFRTIDVSSVSSTSATAPAPTPAPAPSTSGSTATPASSTSTSAPTSSSSTATPPSSTTSTTAPTAPAPPTESSAALLPIGATVGSAGLPTLPYTMKFWGNYFQIADFMAGIDDLVKTGKASVQADGRLATIDGFSLDPGTNLPPGVLVANLAVTTYVTPATQGLTAGATSAGPPSTTPVEQATSTVQSQNASSSATAAATP
jgi:Tfp pilus assembly protein PilO